MKIGILAYGSLIDDLGSELVPFEVARKDVVTPFPVEYARSSETRGGGPTLIPVPEESEVGAKVQAKLIELRAGLWDKDVTNMLYRRERHEVGNLKITYNPGANTGSVNKVWVERETNWEGLDVVLYTRIGCNIAPLTPDRLAELAIQSAKNKTVKIGEDGISYLRRCTEAGVRTKLSDDYTQRILAITHAADLREAYQKARR
jgi:hypothetical protein